MTNLLPGATWRPMPGQEKRSLRRKGRGVGFHIAVSERPSIYEINLGTGNDAHLYVRRDGSCEQNVDLDRIAYAGAAGNPTMLWVETQGGTTPADVKSGLWTPQQAETLAQIAAYAHRTEGAPLQVMPDSRPASRGVGTHRLGIQHSRGVGAVPGWLLVGGEKWSSAVGKECPGDARIGQVPAIVARAIQIVNGDDMPSADEVATAVWDRIIPQAEGIGPASAAQFLQHVAIMATRAANAISADPDHNGQDRLGDLWQQADRNTAALLAAIGGGAGKVDAAAIAAAIPDDIAEQVAAKLAERLAS